MNVSCCCCCSNFAPHFWLWLVLLDEPVLEAAAAAAEPVRLATADVVVLEAVLGNDYILLTTDRAVQIRTVVVLVVLVAAAAAQHDRRATHCVPVPLHDRNDLGPARHINTNNYFKQFLVQITNRKYLIFRPRISHGHLVTFRLRLMLKLLFL